MRRRAKRKRIPNLSLPKWAAVSPGGVGGIVCRRGSSAEQRSSPSAASRCPSQFRRCASASHRAMSEVSRQESSFRENPGSAAGSRPCGRYLLLPSQGHGQKDNCRRGNGTGMPWRLTCGSPGAPAVPRFADRKPGYHRRLPRGAEWTRRLPFFQQEWAGVSSRVPAFHSRTSGGG